MAERVNRAPALVVSVLFHVLVIGASLVAWPWKKEVKPLAVTPVTILTSAELAALTAALGKLTPVVERWRNHEQPHHAAGG